jgi:acetolactate synthase small subunit
MEVTIRLTESDMERFLELVDRIEVLEMSIKDLKELVDVLRVEKYTKPKDL